MRRCIVWLCLWVWPAMTLAGCILAPYRDRIDENKPFAREVNAHLTAMKHQGDEDHWAFVFMRGDHVRVQRFKRGKLDVNSGHESLPRTFGAVGCTAVSKAMLIKYEVYGRPTLILGVNR